MYWTELYFKVALISSAVLLGLCVLALLFCMMMKVIIRMQEKMTDEIVKRYDESED